MRMQDASFPLLERVESLILASERGEINAAEAEELNQILRDTPEARRFYARYMLETVSLRAWAASIGQNDVLKLPCVDGRRRTTSCDESAQAADGVFAVLGSWGDAWGGTVGFFSKGWPLAYLVATIILAIGLWIGSLLPAMHPIGEMAHGSKQAQPSHGSASELVARITGMVDCQWSKEGRPPIGYDFVFVGRQFKLDSGLVEISYDSGAKVILEGPVTYEVKSPQGGYLSLGKLTARLEKKEERRTKNEELSASGSSFLIPHSYFAVRTPTATVTDLGTEFGVQVADDGGTETQVFVGSVRFVAKGMEGHGKTLTTGQIAIARRDSVGIATRVAAESDDRRFVRSMPASERIRQADAYAKLVSSLSPAAYYRMDKPNADVNGNIVGDSAPGQHAGVYYTGRGFRDPYGLSQFGHALWFGGPGSGDYALVRDYPKTATGELSVSVWVYAKSRPIWASIAKNWGRMKHGQFFLGLTADDGDVSVYVQDEQGKDVSVREGHGAALPLEQWQHVAFVADGHTLRLYRNGREVASTAVAGINPMPAAKSLGIGTKPDDTGERAISTLSDCWHGWIDELAIFDRALRPDEIVELARRASRRQSDVRVPITPDTQSGR